MTVLLYLLDTLFFFLTGAALLRAWMNTRRMRMTQQPGQFVMAITDWIVRPVRRVLPRAWAQANVDWGSLVAALILAVLYALSWHALAGGMWLGGPVWLVSLPLLVVVFLARTVLQGLMLLALAYAVLSWVQQQASPVYGMLERLVAPLLQPIRRVVPPIGGVDLSVLILLILLQVGLMLLG